jgi:hypothetical protein
MISVQIAAERMRAAIVTRKAKDLGLLHIRCAI